MWLQASVDEQVSHQRHEDSSHAKQIWWGRPDKMRIQLGKEINIFISTESRYILHVSYCSFILGWADKVCRPNDCVCKGSHKKGTSHHSNHGGKQPMLKRLCRSLWSKPLSIISESMPPSQALIGTSWNCAEFLHYLLCSGRMLLVVCPSVQSGVEILA